MPAYLVEVSPYATRAEAEEQVARVRRRDAFTIHDAPPVILAGLVKGGEIRTVADWWDVWPVAHTHVLVDSSGRFVPCTLASARGALPITWYRYEAP